MRKWYQIKLLKPKTRIVTPVNCTTLDKSDLNSCASMGNMGAIARGPKPWAKETKVAEAVVEAFQNGSQFFKHYHVSGLYLEECRCNCRFGALTNGSWGSLEGCGTSTRSAADLIKWWFPASIIISVPGMICMFWSSSISRSTWIGETSHQFPQMQLKLLNAGGRYLWVIIGRLHRLQSRIFGEWLNWDGKLTGTTSMGQIVRLGGQRKREYLQKSFEGRLARLISTPYVRLLMYSGVIM